MKIAILLFGISLDFQYNRTTVNSVLNNFENYKEKILDCYEEDDVDIYVCTNEMSKINKKRFLEVYKPKDYVFMEGKNDLMSLEKRNIKIKTVLELCSKSGIVYDNILLTRFDLHFYKKITDVNINYDKFNIPNLLPTINWSRARMQKTTIPPNVTFFSEDNFYLFPYKYLNKFLNMISENQKMLGHLMTCYIYDIIREDDENPIRKIDRHPKNLNLTGKFYNISRKQISAGNNLQYQVDTLEKYIYYLEDKIEILNKNK